MARSTDPLQAALTAPIAPMEARLVSALPDEPGWQYEPKWDGFRAIVVRRDDELVLWSKSGKPLDRYFPELRTAFLGLGEKRFVLDGEIVVPVGSRLSFGALQARLHPAASRVERLSHETPAQIVLFDLLHRSADAFGHRPLTDRRAELEAFHARNATAAIRLSPASADVVQARAWLAEAGGALDGVIAKPLDQSYRTGERAMAKVKQRRTADCIVAGFRETTDGTGVASLLLGLFNDHGEIDHVGFTSGMPAGERKRLLGRLRPVVGPPGFTGRAPGGPCRWNNGEEKPWFPLRTELVVEVGYDQVTDGRFRHGTTLVRWRPDKRPDQCTTEQLQRELSPAEMRALLA
ncbi:ATP-dependent DNA ligase [Sphingomonas sp.]|jgi:ATP-dependent DNA ligase|uniref:ATP-dependent DNA ligase n=1 Tax=Sphingomonas sp. TaxID=28214 RepID=UPI002E34ABF3|nr:ATP-dependent DNA ligase [Sphingomonas sp.]HEX4693354.1 ATP-dependent DNA ligase [Sphingomonas sp.]